jgi:hypothetical protein
MQYFGSFLSNWESKHCTQIQHVLEKRKEKVKEETLKAIIFPWLKL